MATVCLGACSRIYWSQKVNTRTCRIYIWMPLLSGKAALAAGSPAKTVHHKNRRRRGCRTNPTPPRKTPRR